jgi:succinylglutamate desuccinylase
MGFMALVHGNEYLGLPILNSFIKSILNGEVEFTSDIYFALGNIPAALNNCRYVEEDLNRSFGRTSSDTSESKRARELETLMLDHCDFLIDLHQTISPSENPFFIFQYSSERCLSMIKKWNPGIPTVLQQDQIGENTGLSTDEYLRSRQKFGTALELGQLGQADLFDLGLSICKKALSATELVFTKNSKQSRFPLLNLTGSYKVKNSSYRLDDGWKNLMFFTAGERLGSCDEGVILAPTSGYMLFPRYRKLKEGEDLFSYCVDFNYETPMPFKFTAETFSILSQRF